MVKNDNIRIKRKKADFLLYGFSYLFFILAGIFLISLPFLPIAPPSQAVGYAIMGVGILFAGSGLILYCMLLYRGICPTDALVITNKGFTSYLVGGKNGVYVEWVNIASMKVFGLTKAPMLGLTLSDTDSYVEELEGRYALHILYCCGDEIAHEEKIFTGITALPVPTGGMAVLEKR